MEKPYGGYVWEIVNDPRYIQSWKAYDGLSEMFVSLEYTLSVVRWISCVKEGTLTCIEFRDLTSFEIAADRVIHSVNNNRPIAQG